MVVQSTVIKLVETMRFSIWSPQDLVLADYLWRVVVGAERDLNIGGFQVFEGLAHEFDIAFRVEKVGHGF